MTRGARIRATTLATARGVLPMAECDDCDWSREASPDTWPAVREAARRHAAYSGHTVSAEYRTVYAYGVTATRPES